MSLLPEGSSYSYLLVDVLPPLSYFSSDCNHSASTRLAAALTLRRRLCLIFFSPAVVVVLEHLMSASPCGDDSEELEPLCSQTLPPFVGCSPSGWLCIFGPMFLVCLPCQSLRSFLARLEVLRGKGLSSRCPVCLPKSCDGQGFFY